MADLNGKKNDKLALLKIEKEPILVGEVELVLKTSTLAQQKLLVEALGGLELGALFAAAKPIFEKDANWFEQVTIHGADLWSKIVAFVADAGTEVVGDLVAVLCDNVENFKTLAETADSGVKGSPDRPYVGEDAVKKWLKGNITVPQATYVVKAAVRLNGYADMGKALTRLLFQATGQTPLVETKERVVIQTVEKIVEVPTDLSHLTGPGPSTPEPAPSLSTPARSPTSSDPLDPSAPIIG